MKRLTCAPHYICRPVGSFNFDQSLIERLACENEVDREILRLLFGSSGLLPKYLALKLDQFKLSVIRLVQNIANKQTHRERIRWGCCRKRDWKL
jgi:hypothetical protein